MNGQFPWELPAFFVAFLLAYHRPAQVEQLHRGRGDIGVSRGWEDLGCHGKCPLFTPLKHAICICRLFRNRLQHVPVFDDHATL